MLQRIQTVWLLLATGFEAITFRLPFYNGDWSKDAVQANVELNATTTIYLTILSIIAAGLAFATIFLYHNRKLQLRLCYAGILLTIVLLTLYFLEIGNFLSGNIALWALFYFAVLGCFFFAAKGIRHDEKLIRSMDRLR